jgi:LPXTG-site transpeptidase (sortase) family protein
MNKRTILRAAALATLFLLAVILGWLCFGGTEESGLAVEIAAPVRAADTPEPSSEVTPEIMPTPQAEETAASQPTEVQSTTTAKGNFGTLTIGRKDIPIAGNVDEATLDKSPGWMSDSALPGESGMCVILGHRNRKHLRPLEKVEIGDELIFTYPDGRAAAYIVTETMIYENTADWRLPAVDSDTLVIVTCWPFRYSGSAPGKFQAVAMLAE